MLEVATLKVCDNLEVGLSFMDGNDPKQTGRISVQACNSTVLKPCQVTWISVKMSENFSKGRVPELSPALIERGLSHFGYMGFTGETIGQPYIISVGNKPHIAVLVNEGRGWEDYARHGLGRVLQRSGHVGQGQGRGQQSQPLHGGMVW